jgi:hypothetical protein
MSIAFQRNNQNATKTNRMIRIYLDTCAYVKTYITERGSSVVERLIDLAVYNKRKIKIFMSYWVINEMTSVIDRIYIHKEKIKNSQRAQEIKDNMK